MGTRADFYIGEGEQAEWIGSIAWDGYPEGIDKMVLVARTIDQYKQAVQQFLGRRTDATVSTQGWPWPWDNSLLTDYTYCFVGHKVLAWTFGRGPFDPQVDQEPVSDEKIGRFPDMSAIKNVAYGQRSGLTIVSVPK